MARVWRTPGTLSLAPSVVADETAQDWVWFDLTQVCAASLGIS
jgi:hypothetical protein